jgi:capsular polysaccharide biosynthesis protein
MAKSLGSKSFWLLAVLLAVIVFVVGINRTKIYQAEIRILILPKNEVMARSIDQVIENAREIPRSLTFYDRLLEANPGAEELIAGLPDDQRRDAWNKMIRIKRAGKSGIVSVSAFSDEQQPAEDLALRITNDLKKVMGKYYEIPAGIDIKNVDGPIAYKVSRADLLRWGIFSLLAGFVISLIVFSFWDFSRNDSKTKKISDRSAASLKGLGRFDFRKEVRAEDPAKKAAAPPNLPIAEQPFFSATEAQKSEPKLAGKEIPLRPDMKHPPREATPEEVRERLNKLLKGI